MYNNEAWYGLVFNFFLDSPAKDYLLSRTYSFVSQLDLISCGYAVMMKFQYDIQFIQDSLLHFELHVFIVMHELNIVCSAD